MLIPAKYEMVSEQVMDKPAQVVWEKGRGLIEKVAFGTGEIMYLKEVPATYKTVTTQVLPMTKTIAIPEQVKV